MSKFNLNTIIQDYGLDKNVVAQILFPNVKYPRRALMRIIKEKGELSIGQLEKLAQFINVPANNLFDCKDCEIKTVDSQLIFNKGEYCIKINNILPGTGEQKVSIFNGKTTYTTVCNVNNLTVTEMLNYFINLTQIY